MSYGTFFEGVSGAPEGHSGVSVVLALLILVAVGIALWVRHG